MLADDQRLGHAPHTGRQNAGAGSTHLFRLCPLHHRSRYPAGLEASFQQPRSTITAELAPLINIRPLFIHVNATTLLRAVMGRSFHTPLALFQRCNRLAPRSKQSDRRGRHTLGGGRLQTEPPSLQNIVERTRFPPLAAGRSEARMPQQHISLDRRRSHTETSNGANRPYCV